MHVYKKYIILINAGTPKSVPKGAKNKIGVPEYYKHT